MPAMKHAVKANDELHIIEVKVGDEWTEEDIDRIEWEWQENHLRSQQ